MIIWSPDNSRLHPDLDFMASRPSEEVPTSAPPPHGQLRICSEGKLLFVRTTLQAAACVRMRANAIRVGLYELRSWGDRESLALEGPVS